MTTNARFLFLGTGGSLGIPVVGCRCAVCQSESPCNRRLRPSALITVENKRFLIDCGPDFRTQALTHKIDHLDGILLTHSHHDHIAGIDELRVYYMWEPKPIPCLLSEETAADVMTRFPYIFDKSSHAPAVRATLSFQQIHQTQGKICFQHLNIRYFTYVQAGMKINGYRLGNLAYVSDIKHYDESIFKELEGVDTLILSALRFAPSPVHITVDEAVAFSKKAKVKQTWLTHVAHELDHEEANAYLPPNVRMAYDGLELHFNADLC